MDIQHVIEDWFVAGTVILCLVLAFLFGAFQSGLL
jgi:hypothetical protein